MNRDAGWLSCTKGEKLHTGRDLPHSPFQSQYESLLSRKASNQRREISQLYFIFLEVNSCATPCTKKLNRHLNHHRRDLSLCIYCNPHGLRHGALPNNIPFPSPSTKSKSVRMEQGLFLLLILESRNRNLLTVYVLLKIYVINASDNSS